ncbi:FlgD immunoglobulin-like domain containing protein, partial [Candidatus Eisenbacteria bacterium]
WGTPVLDNFRVGVFDLGTAPRIVFNFVGAQFHDGFGQRFPTAIEPADVGNSNVGRSLNGESTEENDWLADTTCVTGPAVLDGYPETRYLVKMFMRIARKGPVQDHIPEYLAWRTRLSGNPEEGFVGALMDSSETVTPVQVTPLSDRFRSYFHEWDVGFDPAFDDNTPEQEILPDETFVPGTRIEYYFASFWYDDYPNPDEDEVYIHGPYEFEILPGMWAVRDTCHYDVVWPSILYIDAYNRGAQPIIEAAFAQLGIIHDRYDYLDACSCWNTSMARSFGGTVHNPGGYGNNGFTLEQLLGYRLVLLSTGSGGLGGMEDEDFELLEDWLNDETMTPHPQRGIIFDGNQAAAIIEDSAPTWARTDLGVSVKASAYWAYNNDSTYCVGLVNTPGAVFDIGDSLSLYDNWCPNILNYNVLDVVPETPGTVGNLDFYNYTHNPHADSIYVSYAQVVRETNNWKSIVNGFSLDRLSEVGCGGEYCNSATECIVAGAVSVLQPALEWLALGGNPFDPWYVGIGRDAVDEEGHLSGPVNYLYAARPNPFHRHATVRFQLAQPGRATLQIFDVSGRLVSRLVDKTLDAGEHTLVWDSRDDRGLPVGSGIFWIQLETHDGFRSCKRLLTLQ